MTGVVLALAGLTCGDGGMRAGAAAPLTERVRLDFSREWEGTFQFARGFSEPVRLSKGQLTMFPLGLESTQPFALTLSPGGPARGSWGEKQLHGTYRLEGGRLLFCVVPADDPLPIACTFRDGLFLFTLKPAAQRKPQPAGRTNVAIPVQAGRSAAKPHRAYQDTPGGANRQVPLRRAPGCHVTRDTAQVPE